MARPLARRRVVGNVSGFRARVHLVTGAHCRERKGRWATEVVVARPIVGKEEGGGRRRARRQDLEW